MKATVAVIGGGIVGLATAYRYLERHPGSSVTIVEKEREVGRHQSGHNSGVLHAGLYYRPGSGKARLATSGIRRMTAFCAEHGIAHEICGKLVVAADESEIPRLRALMERGAANGLRGLRWLEAAEAREIEPHVGGVAAVQVPEEGIADFPGVCRALAARIEALGGTLEMGTRVEGVQRARGEWILETQRGEVRTRALVNCAGLHSDRIARMAGERLDLRIVPFRGEYYRLRAQRRELVRHLIYPVPDPAFPFLGVHLTRGFDGEVEAGPNAVLALAREGYDRWHVNARDLVDAIGFPGLWRFLSRHPRASWMELRRSFSKTLFAGSLRRLVPEIQEDDLEPHPEGAGVRAQAVAMTGDLVNDFHFLVRPGAVHLLNAPSPGATASLAIGDEVVTRIDESLV